MYYAWPRGDGVFVCVLLVTRFGALFVTPFGVVVSGVRLLVIPTELPIPLKDGL